MAHSGSSRTLGSPCMNAFSPSANVPCNAVDARICSVVLMDDSSGVGQLRKKKTVDVRILKTVHAPSGLGLVPSVCLLPAKDKARGDHPFTVFFSDHIRLRGVYDGHRLEIEYSLPFGFDCFRKLRLLSGRTVFPGYLVGVPSTEVKFSMQCGRLGRRNRQVSMFLASSDVEVSSLLPCLLDVHRSFTFGRHPSPVSITLHRHFVVSRRSFLGHAQVESLSSWVITCTGCAVVARTSLLRKHEKGQRIHLSQLVSAFSHAVPPSTLDSRIRPDVVSGGLSLLEIELCDH